MVSQFIVWIWQPNGKRDKGMCIAVCFPHWHTLSLTWRHVCSALYMIRAGYDSGFFFSFWITRVFHREQRSLSWTLVIFRACSCHQTFLFFHKLPTKPAHDRGSPTALDEGFRNTHKKPPHTHTNTEHSISLNFSCQSNTMRVPYFYSCTICFIIWLSQKFREGTAGIWWLPWSKTLSSENLTRQLCLRGSTAVCVENKKQWGKDTALEGGGGAGWEDNRGHVPFPVVARKLEHFKIL